MEKILKDIFSKLTPRINWREFISFKLMDIFAIGAIIFAYIQFHDAKKTLENLPTTYLDDFPKNMKGIMEKIISPSHQKLMIISDFPIYGNYSNSKMAFEYYTTIQKKAADGLTLDLVFYDYKTRRQQFIHQFKLNEKDLGDSTYFKSTFLKHTCRNGDFTPDDIDFDCRGDKMSNFLNYFPSKTKPKTCNDFFNLMENHHEDFLEKVKIGNKVRIDTVSYLLSSAFWLADDTNLAFSMNSLGNRAQESTFITHDQSIIGFVKDTYTNITVENKDPK